MDRSKVGIIIPALNEEKTISQVVVQCGGYGLPIVVDDGSLDDTSKVSKCAGAEVVTHISNRGYDAALNSGFRRASELGCKFVITIDGDGQHPAELISSVVNMLEEGSDLVLCIRDQRARFAEYCFALMTRFLYGIEDPLCGMKGYRISIYNKLGHFDSYGSIGTELTLFAVTTGYRFAQLPISVSARLGQPRFGKIFYANFRIFRAMIIGILKISRSRNKW